MTTVGKVFDGTTWKGTGILTRKLTSPEFDVLEDKYGGRYCRVSGTYAASGALTITVTGAGTSSAYIFTVGDTIKNIRTGEVMLVATVASGSTITIASTGRAFGTTPAAAGQDGDGLLKIGNASEENSGARNTNTTKVSKATNLAQIFKNSCAISNTAKATAMYGGDESLRERGKMTTDHKFDIENAFLFGEKKSDLLGTQLHPRRTTGGVLEFLTAGNSYVQDQGGILTRPDLDIFIREAFTYDGGASRVLMAGGKVISAINDLAMGHIRTKSGDTSFGLEITEYTSAFGRLNIIHNPLFIDNYAGYAFLLSLENFKYASLRPMEMKLNIQGNDIDGQVDQVMTECGLHRTNASASAILKGVVA